MKDELEKYVEDHNCEFNDYKLDETDKLKLWSKIDAEITKPEPKVIPLWKKMPFRIAASIVILLSCTVSFLMMGGGLSEDQIVNQELNQIDSHYKALVDNQIQLIKTNRYLKAEEKTAFLLLADELDVEYRVLKKELKEGINDQKIIEAIIKNYKRKIQLMEDLLERSYPVKNNFDNSEIIL
jgi:hypothetical protein